MILADRLLRTGAISKPQPVTYVNSFFEGAASSITLSGLQQGDLVLLVVAATSLLTPSGYSLVFSTTGKRICAKYMTSTPDTSITGYANTDPVSGQAGPARAAMAAAFRGVGSYLPTTGLVTELNPPATTQSLTPGEMVVTMATYYNDFDSANPGDITGFPSGYSSAGTEKGNSKGETDHAVVNVCYKPVTVSGVEDPGSYTATGRSSEWNVWTIALEP